MLLLGDEGDDQGDKVAEAEGDALQPSHECNLLTNLSFNT